MWLNIWHLAGSNLDTLSNRVQYESLPCGNRKSTRELERQMFAQVDRLFNQGKVEGVFKPLDNEILSGLSSKLVLRLLETCLGILSVG